MKKILAVFTLSVLIVIACKSSKQKSVLLKPGEIQADEYVIDIQKDTTLVTKNGALLDIPKGTLASDDGKSVTLEIKEAYSIEQMLKGGLTTQSNGELLSSGGMIYINAKSGQNVRITKAIRVAVPSDYLDSSMKLFKGNADDEGNMNWTEPDTLSPNPQIAAIDRGRQLFMANCSNCHSLGKDMTGPDLANILKRKHMGMEGEYPIMHNEDAFRSRYTAKLDSGHSYFDARGLYHCNLRNIYIVSPPISLLDRQEIKDIYRYIQNESDKRELPLPSHAWLDDCVDSCDVYNSVTQNLQQQKYTAQLKKDGLLKDTNPMVIEKKNDSANQVNNPQQITPPVNFDDKVSPQNYGSVYYQFTIETFGWYNIDVLVKGLDGVEESELFVRIIGEYREKVQVYLIVPSAKIYVQGGPAERNPEEFAFLYKNGKINLPQGVKGYIMAVTEERSSLAFVLKEFNTTTRQEFEISLQESTKETFNTAIQRIGGDDLNISVKDGKNAGQLRKTESDLQTIDEELKKASGLKPKNCDCECAWPISNSVDFDPQERPY